MINTLTEDERIFLKALLQSYTEEILFSQQSEPGPDPTATAYPLNMASTIFKKLSLPTDPDQPLPFE